MKTFTRPFVAVLVGGLFVMGSIGCTPAPPDKMKMDPAKACLDARDELRRASRGSKPLTRANAMEAMAQTLGKTEGAVYLEALSDPEVAVRFAAALAIGDARYAPAKDKLLQMAKFKTTGAERDPRVYAGVIYALYCLGNTEHTGDLAAMLEHPEKQVRSNAIVVMGKMGEPSAIPPLKALGLREKENGDGVWIQTLEAMAMLGDPRSIRMLEASVYGPKLEERIIAVRTLGNVPSARSIAVLQKVLYDSERQIIRARVVAAGGLGTLGEFDGYGYKLCATSARQPREVLDAVMKDASSGMSYKVLHVDVVSLQQLAVVALGWLNRPAAVDLIHPLLRKPDTDDSVRVAAAMSILRLLPEYATPRAAASEKPAAQALPVSSLRLTPVKLNSSGGEE